MCVFFRDQKGPPWLDVVKKKVDFEFVGSPKFVESYVSVSRQQQGATEAGAIGCR